MELLKQVREKAAQALSAAIAIRDEMKARPAEQQSADWPTDKQSAFDKAMKDFRDANQQATILQARADAEAEITQASAQYLQAAGHMQSNAGEGAGETVDGLGGANHYALFQTPEKKKAHRHAFAVFARYGLESNQFKRHMSTQAVLGPREQYALLSTDDTLGGFLVPEDFQAEVIRAEAGIAVIRGMARVQPTSRDTLVWPKVKPHATDSRRTSGFAGQFQQQGYVTGGTAPTTQNQPTFMQERIPVHDWQPTAVEISPNTLEDAVVNVEQLLAELIAECLAFDEDDKFLSGTGVNEPEGILNSGFSLVNSGNASKITWEGLIDLMMAVPPQFRSRGSFLMKSTTYGALLKIQDGAGNYVIPPNSQPNTLWGKPISFHEGMDSIAASNTPIIFGDFKRYIIAERQGLRVQRLVERYAPNVGFLPSSRIGGQVVLTDALRGQYISA
jgi:HK97 family phage major capsid protein